MPSLVSFYEQAGKRPKLLSSVVEEAWMESDRAAADSVRTALGGAALGFGPAGERAAAIRDGIGTRVKGITDTTEGRLRRLVVSNAAKGGGINELAKAIREDESGIFGKARARTIARTETGTAYNRGVVAGAQEAGIFDSVMCLDGDDCGWTSHKDPDLANDTVRALADAQAHPLAHPNCRRSFSPWISGQPASRLPSKPAPAAPAAPAPAAPAAPAIGAPAVRPADRFFNSRQYDDYYREVWRQKGDALRAELGEDEYERLKKGVSAYQGNGYKDINKALRGGSLRGYRTPEATLAERISTIDRAFEVAGEELTRDVMVYRGGSVRKAAAFTDKAYVSTTTIPDVTYEFVMEAELDGRGGELMEIILPKGTRVLPPGALSGAFMNEAEYLLPRGAYFELVGERTEDLGLQVVGPSQLPERGKTMIRTYMAVIP